MSILTVTKKRLIVACDGTWVNSDGSFSTTPKHTTPVATNVTRICRALQTEGNGIPQIVYYQAGVGSRGGFISHMLGGIEGSGISENIREAYAFIANNYNDGDEIFLLGFSRGAFTARSVAAFIAAIGLLTKDGMNSFYSIFSDWKNQIMPKYVSRWPDDDSPRLNVTTDGYLKNLATRKASRLNIKIKAVGVWDTVGSLGAPRIGIPHWTPGKYAFIDTKVASNVENAFQALALDEHRRPFSPTVWERPEELRTKVKLKQCWFPGAHSNIGGGYPDTSIPDICLAWMIEQLHEFLHFDPDYLQMQRQLNIEFYRLSKPIVNRTFRQWGLGKLYNSMNSSYGLWYLLGSSNRTPGQYHQTSPYTGFTKWDCPLHDTNETIHASVRIRKKLHAGIEGERKYDPPALKGWTLLARQDEGSKDDDDPDDHENLYKWIRKHKDGSLLVLKEEPLGEVERLLLNLSPQVEEAVTE